MLPDTSIQDVMDIVGFSEKNRSNTKLDLSVYHKASNAAINETSLNSSCTDSPERNSGLFTKEHENKTRQHSFTQSVSTNSNFANIKLGRSSMWSNNNGNYKRSTQKFPCSYCDKVFTRHGGLVGHLRVHTGERPHQCQMCGKRFSDSSSLTKHIRTHTGEKPFLCNICHRAFSISHNLTRHLKLHAKENQNVGSKVQFPDSGNRSNSKTKRSYICSKCSAICQSFTELNSHMQKMHARRHPKTSTILPTKMRIERPNSLAKSTNTAILDNITKNKITETASFTDIQSLGHKEVELKRTIDFFGEDSHLPAKENLFHLMSNNDKLPFFNHSVLDNIDIDRNKWSMSSLVKDNSLNPRRNLLPKLTPEKTSLEIIIPTNLSPSSNSTSHPDPTNTLLRDPLVNIAPESYTDVVSIQQKQEASSLQNQFKRNHPNNKTTWTLKNDNNGKIRQHTKSVSSKQEFSKETYSLKKDKINHNTNSVSIENVEKISSITREHQWQHLTSGTLPEPITLSANIEKETIHNRSFHGQNSSGPTPGPEQTKSQSEKIRSKPARLGDKNYPCLYCDKVFTRPGGLVGHTRVHTGEKPHKCLTCSKRFSDSSSLTKHIRTHTGEKPFQCKLCHRAFSISHNLTRHLKLHSRDKLKKHSRDKLHSREGNYFTKPAGAVAKAVSRIHSNSRPLEKRINKFRSSSTLRKPSLGQTGSEMPATTDYTFDVIKDIHRYPSLVNGRELSKEESVLFENDIKPTDLSLLQIKEISSNAVDPEQLVLTWCPSEEHNYLNRSNENFEQASSIPSFVPDSKYDSVKKFEEKHEPNETLKNSSILNSLDITFPTNSSSSAVPFAFSVNNIESESKMDSSWFDVCGSAEDQGIGSERISPLSNDQCEPSGSSAKKDVNTNGCDSLYGEHFVKKDVHLLSPFEENNQQTPENGTKSTKTSQMYQCGYCLEQFSDMNLLSEHIQVHNKKSELPRNIEEKQTDCFQNDSNFSESFRQTDYLIRSIDFKLEDKNIQDYSKSEEEKNVRHLTTKPRNTFYTETQQTKTKNAKLSSHLSVTTSKTPTKTLNSSSLQKSQTQIFQTETLVNETKSKFRCSYCSKVFTRHGGLIGHLRVHTGEKPYECQTCNKRFSDSSSLTKHIRIHTGEKPFICTICYRAFSISHNLTRHLKLHSRDKQQNVNANKSGNLFKSGKRGARSIRCRYCCATFQCFRVLKNHLRYHSLTSKTLKTGRKNPIGNGKRINDATNPSGEKTEILNPELPFQVNILSTNHSNRKKQFPLVSKIHNKSRRHSFHMTNSSHLGRKYIDKGTNLKTFVKDTLSSTSSTGMTFESPEEMKINEMVSGSFGATKESSDTFILSQNNAIVPSTEFLPKFTEQLKKGFLAFTKDDGGRKLVAQSAEIKQVNEESESRILLKSCQTNKEENLTTNSDLIVPSQEDLKDMLMERKPFLSADINETDKSDNDSKIFSPNYSRNHSREIESNPKTPASISKCGYCHKSFRDFSSLSRHMSVHREQQRRHQKSSMMNSDVLSPLYSRSLSSKRVKMSRLISEKTKSWMSLNKKDVRIYSCPFCAKQFTRHGGLVGHLRVHTGEKPHECQTCSKRFSDSSSLTKHIRTHTGEKPFRCKLCHRAFSISHNLTRHLKLHSRENQKSGTQNQHIKKKSVKCNQEANAGHRFGKNKVLSFGTLLKSDVSRSASVNSKSNYCKKTSSDLHDVRQSFGDKNSASDCQIQNLTSSVSKPTLASDHKFNVHQPNINPENSSSHLRLFPQSVPGITTDHLSVIPASSHSLSNNNLSSNQLLDDQEISLKFKPQFLSSPPKESNVPNNTSHLLGNVPFSDSASQIVQPVTNNHLSPVSKETPSFSSDARTMTDHLVSYNANALKSYNKQSPQISLTKNESENQSKTFSDTFSKTFSLLESLSNYNSTEINNLQPKTNPQTLHTENLQSFPNSYTKNPNPNTRILSPSAFSIEPSMNKNTSEFFLNPTESLRISSSKEDDNFSVETVLSEVSESLTGEQECSFSVDKKVFNSLYTFQNGQTFNNTAESQTNNQKTFTSNTSLSFPDPHQKAPIPKNTCILCRTYFPNLKQLEAHLKVHRTQNKTFTCGYCGRNFTRFSGVMGHARTHTLERPYVCSICQRAFSDSSSLTKHTRTHTGEKPFTCKYCSRAFSISHNLTRHLKLHSREKSKPFQ